MRRIQFSIGLFATILVMLALDMAVIRSLTRVKPGSNQLLYMIPIDETHAMSTVTVAIGILPTLTIIAPCLISLFTLARRNGRISGFGLGFALSGVLAIFAFLTVAALSPGSIQREFEGVIIALGPAIERIFRDVPTSLLMEECFEFGCCLLAFTLPQILLALAGGWILNRSFGSIIVERRSSVEPLLLRG